MSGGSVGDESDISEITTSDLSGREIEPSPWEPRVHDLITRLIPLLEQLLDERCEPGLFTLIHHWIMTLFSDLFSEEVVQGLRRSLDRDLWGILGSYTSQKLRDCVKELLVDVHDPFFSQVNFLTTTDCLQLSNESDDQNIMTQTRGIRREMMKLASATLDIDPKTKRM